ncbi:galactose-1-epimerase [Affinibrenneria salicis]|uniref:Aldose 1-epimerase n=1 Tax=Affinibrenneria salicis TaxID=2590031 RepID=A0A5J5FZV4_9GAMM|nr:galactose-1-epimerase [Affinibrenneria salicis]KAA8999880.1 galactose-1-epimerase [Affinibrenneria salicis]
MLNKQASERAPDGQPFQLISLRNDAGMQIMLMDWGATWLSCQLPLAGGEMREVLLGCATPADYPRQNAYIGASVGRYANRIAHAVLRHRDQTFRLAANSGAHQLHGGPEGFNARRWNIVAGDSREVTLQLHSPDGDQGFPGALTAQVRYRLTEQNGLEIEYLAGVDKPCPVCLTNHAYFNLDGQPGDARHHRLQLFADRYLPVDGEGIPCADPQPVADGGMDFRQPKTLLRDFLQDDDQRRTGGYDHAYLLQPGCADGENPAARLWSADERVQMTVYTSAPALQLYSGNFLAGAPSRQGGQYPNYAGIALESEFLPDSPAHPEWPQPDCWLQPGRQYRSLTVYQFLAR